MCQIRTGSLRRWRQPRHAARGEPGSESLRFRLAREHRRQPVHGLVLSLADHRLVHTVLDRQLRPSSAHHAAPQERPSPWTPPNTVSAFPSSRPSSSQGEPSLSTCPISRDGPPRAREKIRSDDRSGAFMCSACSRSFWAAGLDEVHGPKPKSPQRAFAALGPGGLFGPRSDRFAITSHHPRA